MSVVLQHDFRSEANNQATVSGAALATPMAQPGRLAMKRLMDIMFAVPLMIFSAPLIGIFALLIKIIDAGPAFYVQERVGFGGRTVRVLKLRTMVTSADDRLAEYLAANADARAEWERNFKLENDPRIIRIIGSFLRRSSLDELPQLWNVVRGDMSLVGPRPFPDYHLEAFDAQFRALRQSVPPGLTGLWQVGPRSQGDTGVQQKYDTDYIANWSLALDLQILFKTIRTVLVGSGV